MSQPFFQRGGVPPVLKSRVLIVQPFCLSIPDHFDGREVPIRRRGADQSTLDAVQGSIRGFADPGIRDDLASTFQPVVGVMAADIVPERTTTRQPDHQRSPLIVRKTLNCLLHPYARDRLCIYERPMTVHVPAEAAGDAPHPYQPLERAIERRQIVKLSMNGHLVSEELHVNSSPRSSSCPCRTGRRIRPASHRYSLRCPDVDSAPAQHRLAQHPVATERSAAQHHLGPAHHS